MRWKLRLKLDYWRASPKRCRLRDDGPPPDVACCEIRLFLAAPRLDVDLIQTLTAYFGAGIKRAFVLIDSDAHEAVVIPDRYAELVHVFTCQDKSIGLSLRRLLHRYGPSHWCVLGSLCEVIVDSAASTVNLGDLCADLDAVNSEVLEAASGDGEQIELVARDVRSDRVFRGTAHIARPAHSYDLPASAVSAVPPPAGVGSVVPSIRSISKLGRACP